MKFEVYSITESMKCNPKTILVGVITIFSSLICAHFISNTDSPAENLSSKALDALDSNKSEIQMLADLMAICSDRDVFIAENIRRNTANLRLKGRIERLRTSDGEAFANELERIAVMNALVFREEDNTIILEELFPYPVNVRNTPGYGTMLFREDDILPDDDSKVIWFLIELRHASADYAMRLFRESQHENYQAAAVVPGSKKQLLICDSVRNIKLFNEKRQKFDSPE